MINFFRRVRKKMADDNRPLKYMRYAIGEIVLVVIGILIALQINTWNQSRLRVKKEIEMLKSIESQFKQDIPELDEGLDFYKTAKKSISIILSHIENDLPYHDSLKLHFFTSTRFYGDSDLDNNVFETLKSDGTTLISNSEIREKIVGLYEDDDLWINNFESAYRDFLFNANQNLFNTRFRDFWNGDYKDPTYQGEMIPLDFESLKTDQEYLYFLRTQKNLIGWLTEKPMEETKSNILVLLEDLRDEIDRLEHK